MNLILLLGALLLFSLGVCSTETEAVRNVKENVTNEEDQILAKVKPTLPKAKQLLSNSPKRYRFDYEFNENAGGWLKLHEVPATWQEARLRCHSEGAVLASPLTHQIKEATMDFALDNKFYTSTISTTYTYFWLFTGVHSTFSKGDYTSIEGVPLSRLSVSWAEGEPDNLNNSESCLVIDAADSGLMADKRCDDVYPYVCYKKEKKLTIENECGTTDPEYKLEASTGSCYKMHHTKRSWARAFQTCVGEGGHLAIANSENEARVIGKLIGNIATLVGFHDWGSYGREWMTIHGETLPEAGYAQWAGGEPNNVTYPATGDMGEYCGGINNHGQFNDMPCNSPSPFICELSPGSIL